MRDPWSADPDAWRISGSRGGMPPHGEWRGRLPAGAIACREHWGYSMWHLVAIKALPTCDQETFLISACDQPANELIDDLREHMTVFNDIWKVSWETHSGMCENRLSWRRMCGETMFCSPLEICARLQVPLIGWPDDEESWLDGVALHDVIEAAQEESLRRLV